MAVRFTKDTIFYSKGMTKGDVITALKMRILKREKEIEKREWIVEEYNRLKSKQSEDLNWLSWCEKNLVTDADKLNNTIPNQKN